MNIAHATIGNGKAVHAVKYDIDDPKFGLLVLVNGNRFSASTRCGQVSGPKGYRRKPNGQIEAEITCAKCLKY